MSPFPPHVSMVMKIRRSAVWVLKAPGQNVIGRDYHQWLFTINLALSGLLIYHAGVMRKGVETGEGSQRELSVAVMINLR